MADSGICTLTFDDGPDPRWTPRVLWQLRRCRAHATFFAIGERVARAPETIRAIRELGHDVELHCHRHVRHSELDEDALERDTVTALETFALAGVTPTRWRPPWGIVTEATRDVAARHHLELVRWTIDTHDWRGDPGHRMLELATLALHDGAVILMHDGLGPGARRDGCFETVELIAPLIWTARRGGLQVLSLSEADGLMLQTLGSPPLSSLGAS
jgi:peptidoglycan/xylan/chitin deacetylase (PgdA/CDA1 family)